ncbi:two-component sensor histidine kinase [Actinoallomurus iriomotensis]|uniref:Two-component sensor histidine kinase n=1 Tax=Actinoallomurus iriomotensis TaxID=478107 RepID=A0A9W6VMP7_9ACTN|nr:two-component sensor histidine kinase [Actinoallomurus iriomotensis]
MDRHSRLLRHVLGCLSVTHRDEAPDAPGSAPDFAGRIDDGPGPFGIYPWLLVGAGAVSDVAHGRARPLWASAPLLGLFVALVLAAIWFGFRRGRGDRLASGLLVALTADAFVLNAWFGHGMAMLFPLAAMAAGVVVPWTRRPWPVVVVGMLAVLGGVATWLRGASPGDGFTVGYSTLISGFIVSIILLLFGAIRELRETREELARTAVSEERLRFARDLHDLLGHTLSVMVIKAQAVRKLIPRDTGLAAGQAADIETIGRDALRQVRLAVSGYRGRGLAAEIDGARTALRDAGIEPTVRQEGTPLPDEAGSLLGWVVREGVTNVIRHSGAGTCEISVHGRVDTAVLSIRDDGRGGPPVMGNGLLGLTERVSGAGGRLQAGPDERGGYRLTVTVPLNTLPVKGDVS